MFILPFAVQPEDFELAGNEIVNLKQKLQIPAPPCALASSMIKWDTCHFLLSEVICFVDYSDPCFFVLQLFGVTSTKTYMFCPGSAIRAVLGIMHVGETEKCGGKNESIFQCSHSFPPKSASLKNNGVAPPPYPAGFRSLSRQHVCWTDESDASKTLWIVRNWILPLTFHFPMRF